MSNSLPFSQGLIIVVISLVFSCATIADTASKIEFFDESYKYQLLEMQQDPAAYISAKQVFAFRSKQDFQTLFVAIQAYEALGKKQLAAEKLRAGITASFSNELESGRQIRAILFEKMSDLLFSSSQFEQARQAIGNAINQGNADFGTLDLVNRLQKRAKIDTTMGANIDALQDLQLALQLAKTIDNEYKISEIAMSIMKVHQSRSEHSIAVSYANQALTTLRQRELPHMLAQALVLSAESYIAVNQSTIALNHLLEAEKILSSTPDQNISAQLFKNKAKIALQATNTEQAIEFAKQAIALSGETSSSSMADSHLLLSMAYAGNDDIDAAIEHLVTAFEVIQNQQIPFSLLQNLHLHRAELLSILGRYEDAYRLTKHIVESRELNQPIDEMKRMLDMHTNFQLKLQQQENIKLKQENESQETELENKAMLTQLYSVIMVLLFLSSILLFLLFIRTRNHRKNLEQIAHRDHLTDLYSRRRIFEILSFQHDMFRRNKQAYCIAIVDLDHFKKINDNYGHQIGDEVLKAFAQIAKECFRKTDSIGRIGGEEFLFIFPETPLNQGERLLNVFSERIRKISERLKLDQVTTASVGMVSPSKTDKISEALKRADEALYSAKENGRDQIVTGD
ncbi:diguanylate cyclase [Agaribacter flavus]|uniref:diguanylate cyclase n=1 Tax=Agaribacter flavus TaxID=1902781 RepID=A0ABV7FX01_9ALTE